jgi:hypothetical protein
MIAASVHSDKSVFVIFAETGVPFNPSLPEGEVPHTIEPFGENGVAILSELGSLYCFENGSKDPTLRFQNVVSVASTRQRTIFLRADGRICEIVQRKTLFVTGIPDLPIKVYAGGAHFGCVTFEGNAFAWGTGTHGQLGTGSFMNSEDPRPVRIPHGRKIVDAAAGEEHTVFVIVAAQKFSQLLPKIMLQAAIPTGIANLSVVAYGDRPSEFDIKF